MKKIPTIFVRNPENMKELLNKQHPECSWVFEGEGIPTRKYDGTCCKVEDGKLFKRREIKKGKLVPNEFVQEQLDNITGKRVGWMPVNCQDLQDKYHCAAFDGQPDGTYELCGPKIQGNPERFDKHVLISHAKAFVFDYCPTNYKEIKVWLLLCPGEGVVWHHRSDRRMAKIKKRDFNMN